MKKVFVLLFTMVLLSCQSEQNKTKKEDTTTKEQVAKSKTLVLEIDLETSKPEDMRLLTMNSFLNNGQFMDLHITQKINANETSKKFRFEMPENITPDNFIGISLGVKFVKEVKINSMNISYGDLNYNIPSEAVLDFFKTNKFIDYDETSNVFRTKQVEGKHNPILILRKLYIDKIQGIK